MAEAEKFNIDGTWYDVSDPTARAAASAASTAASNAQATANSKLSDAPSDGKQYLRKNGAWAEAEAPGPSLPTGGTIGQVLAKNSDTDGDAGWYSLRHLPSDKWYLPDGILESDVIAAYQFVGRLDEAEALLNVNDGTEYPLSKVLGTEIWSLGQGFFIPATRNAGLNNTALAGLYANFLSAAFGFSGGPDSVNSIGPGITPNLTRILELNSFISRHLQKPVMSAYSGSAGYVGPSMAVNGVLAGNWENPPKMYRDGAALSLTTPGNVYGSVTSRNKVFGQMDGNETFASCYVTALVFYNVTLTASQHLELSDNIRALGGID